MNTTMKKMIMQRQTVKLILKLAKMQNKVKIRKKFQTNKIVKQLNQLKMEKKIMLNRIKNPKRKQQYMNIMMKKTMINEVIIINI